MSDSWQVPGRQYTREASLELSPGTILGSLCMRRTFQVTPSTMAGQARLLAAMGLLALLSVSTHAR